MANPVYSYNSLSLSITLSLSLSLSLSFNGLLPDKKRSASCSNYVALRHRRTRIASRTADGETETNLWRPRKNAAASFVIDLLPEKWITRSLVGSLVLLGV